MKTSTTTPGYRHQSWNKLLHVAGVWQGGEMKQGRKKGSLANPFLELTWIDIQDWAGSNILSRGKSYQRTGCVEELGITKKNEIVAWVEGSARYATRLGW